MTYNVIIAEDEKLSAELLSTILIEINDDIGPFKIVAVCHSGEETLAAVKKYNPDILFLDINMPQGDGFSVVEALDEDNNRPSIIFTTAHSRFAVKAFDVEAVDYLLKPLSNEKVIRAINRALKMRVTMDEYITIKVPTKDGSDFITSDTIDAMEASGDYIYIYTDQRKIMMRGTLRDYVDKLAPDFCQTHRSYLININSIASINRRSKNTVTAILHSGEEIPVSRRYKSTLLKKLPDTT